jgi:N-acetylmuramoyl-L-alanine amidase
MKIEDIFPKGFVSSPNNSGAFIKGPLGIVIHFTAGGSGSSSAAWLKNPDSKASAHVVVDYDGKIIPVVHPSLRAWHAGTSQLMGMTGCNNFTLGIEVANPGPLTRNPDGSMKTIFNKNFDGPFITAAQGLETRYYASYTEAQFVAVKQLCQLLCATYSIDPAMIVGHEHVSPGRKVDPGPAWDWSRLDDMVTLPGNIARYLLLQHFIEINGQELGEIDGIFGPKSLAALKALTGESFAKVNDADVVRLIKDLRKRRPKL